MKISRAVPIVMLLALCACGKPEQPTIGLYPAIQRGDIDQIERHIKWGADINQIDVDGRRPLHVAAAQGELVVVKLLLNNGADINARDGNGNTPVYTAVMQGRTQLAALLIEQGAQFDANEILDKAVMSDITDRDIVRFLTRYGADVNHLDANGSTPLMQAIGRDNRVLVKHLIAYGADVNHPDGNGKFPLDLATSRGNKDIASLLTRNGARSGPK
ncbi:MAG: ankyrin repeat domain-containing protein [Gammaproteobacteria bacterium]|nr:ankyrin repeat domain-containing protein [Gammaproteobacteria bacterium]